MYLYIRLYALNFMLNNMDYLQHCEDLNGLRGNTNLEIRSEEYNRYRGAIALIGASIRGCVIPRRPLRRDIRFDHCP